MPANSLLPLFVLTLLANAFLVAVAIRGLRRGQFGPDVAATDQYNALGLCGLLAQRVGVADRAQVMDAVELGAVGAQDAHVRPGCQECLVETHLVLVRELGDPRLEVERQHAGASQEIDALLFIPIGRAKHDVPARFLPAPGPP